MLRGIAHGGGDELPDDRHAIVVALSQLSEKLASAESETAFAAAAETAGALVRVPRAVVFVKRGDDELYVGGVFGPVSDADLLTSAREVAREALVANVPLLISNTAAHSSSYARILARHGVASVICVPMRVADVTVGAIVGLSDDLRAFSPGDIELLHVVASHAALAVLRSDPKAEPAEVMHERHDELIRLADRKIQELSLLNQVSEAMSSTLELDALLDIALEQSLAAVGADAGSLMLIGEETNKLEIVASRGLARELVQKTSQEVGKSIAGWVAEHGESVLVTDAHKDSRFAMPFFRDSITSSASVPLKSKGLVIGVLNVNTVRADRLFDERDLELLGTVSNQMAVAIENARLYSRIQRRTQQLTSLLHISRTVTSTLNLDEVMRRLSDEICKTFQLEVFVVLLVDEISGRLRLGHGSGLKTRRKYVYYDVAVPLALRVKRTGHRLVVRDVGASPSLSTGAAQAEGLGAAVAIPLRNQGKLEAVGVGFAREPRVFPRSQRAVMGPIGDLAGVAIHNARVYRQKYRIASMLQQRLMPSSIPQVEGLEIGHKLLPAREVGGDYYDFMAPGPNSVAVVLSDVSGSDVEAAEYTTMGKYVLRAYARECSSPAEILTKTNNLICENTSAEVFISAFFGIIDLNRGKLVYANAGCEPAVFYRAADRSIGAIPADGVLLGIRGGSTYEERELDLEPGDIIAIFTDGLTEARLENDRFGAQSVMDIILGNARLRAQKIADRLHDALIEFTRGRIADDVAMVVIKVV